MCYFDAAAGRQSNAPHCCRRYGEPPPGKLGNVGSQPPPSALKSCTRFSDTLVVLVAYCCSACSSIRSASCPIFLRLPYLAQGERVGGVRTSTTVLVN